MVDFMGPLETIEDTPRRVDVSLKHWPSRGETRPIYWVALENSEDPEWEGWFVNKDGSVHLANMGVPVRNREPQPMTDAEKLARLKQFLVRVSGYGGPVELSYQKVEGEYRYLHKKARELYHELFPLPDEQTVKSTTGDDF